MSSIADILHRHIATAIRDTPAVGVARRVALVPTVRATNEDKRQITFVASTETVDRYGDVIRVAGWETRNYMQNPVFLWAHKSSEPPIGKTVSLTTESNPPALVQVVQFASKETYGFADTIFNLYKGGFLKAVSVGFKPLAKPKLLRDPETDQITGFEFTSQELLELSAVPLPANPDAVARAIETGVLTEPDASKFFAESHTPERAAQADELRRCLVQLEFEALNVALLQLKGRLLLHSLTAGEAPHASSSEINSLQKLEDALRGKVN